MIFAKKLRHSYIWKRIFYERLTEPLHLNFLSAFVFLFGSFRRKVEFDLIFRAQHAYCILNCADQAKALGISRVTLVEFGVAAGAGLLNIAAIAEKVSLETGVQFDIYGFDTGVGMPPPKSFRDHPELYQKGDFKMDVVALKKALPKNVTLILGEVQDTVPVFLKDISNLSPIGFVSLDLDYYYSTKEAMEILRGKAGHYLPRTMVYLDDLEDQHHNSYCGEQLAVAEFNQENELRKIEKHPFLRSYRIFKNARWIDHIFTLHVLDHPQRNRLEPSRVEVTLTNPYLGTQRTIGSTQKTPTPDFQA